MSLDTAPLRVRGQKLVGRLAQAVTAISVDHQTGIVGELAVAVADPDNALGGTELLATGAEVIWDGDEWEVGGRTSTYGADNTLVHEFACRSALARSLRRRFKASAERRVSPSEWVTRRVTAAGGQAVCQPSSKQGTIAQTSGSERQSELDVIANLASDLEWDWVESRGRLLFGSRHWAWSTGFTGQSTWLFTWGRRQTTDALSGEFTVDDDDTDNQVAGTLAVPYDAARAIRPWDLVRARGFIPEAETFLVESIQLTANPADPATLTLTQPRPPARKSGSSS